MTDYIKREDAKRVLNKGLRYMRAFGVNRCLTMIDEVPSSDVVEVVRCGNCKYWQNYNDVMVCGLTNAMMSVSDYCSYGEVSHEES